jgi:hypothetical protein
MHGESAAKVKFPMSTSLLRMVQSTTKPRKAPQKMDCSLKLRCLRPSLLDRRFQGDAWIVDQGNGWLALQLGDYTLTQFLGLSLDLPSLNRRLDQVWNRRPRHAPQAIRPIRAVAMAQAE